MQYGHKNSTHIDSLCDNAGTGNLKGLVETGLILSSEKHHFAVQCMSPELNAHKQKLEQASEIVSFTTEELQCQLSIVLNRLSVLVFFLWNTFLKLSQNQVFFLLQKDTSCSSLQEEYSGIGTLETQTQISICNFQFISLARELLAIIFLHNDCF